MGLNHHLLKAPEGRSSLNSCLINCTVVIGSKSLYCIYFGASWTVFSVITSPNRNLSGYNLKYKWGGTVRTHIRKMVEIAPRSSASGCQNVFCFFCYHDNAAFRPLILHRFWTFLKQQTWIAFRMRTPVKNFRISSQRIFQVPKQPKIRYSRVGCWW